MMDSFLSNRTQVSGARGKPESEPEASSSSLHSLDEKTETVHEGNETEPKVQLLLEDNQVSKILITMPDGTYLELNCEY